MTITNEVWLTACSVTIKQRLELLEQKKHLYFNRATTIAYPTKGFVADDNNIT